MKTQMTANTEGKSNLTFGPAQMYAYLISRHVPASLLDAALQKVAQLHEIFSAQS